MEGGREAKREAVACRDAQNMRASNECACCVYVCETEQDGAVQLMIRKPGRCKFRVDSICSRRLCGRSRRKYARWPRRDEAREDGHLEEQIGIQSDEAGNDDNVKTEQEHRQIL